MACVNPIYLEQRGGVVLDAALPKLAGGAQHERAGQPRAARGALQLARRQAQPQRGVPVSAKVDLRW